MRFRRPTTLALAVGVAAAILAAPAAAFAAADTTPPSVGPPTVAGVTPTTLTASWAPGTDDVGITGYQIQLIPQGAQGQIVDTAAPVTSHRFTGLTPGHGYSIALRARDAAGNWSLFIANPAITFLPTDVTPPTTPGPAVGSNITSSSFTVSWAPSTDNIGVTQYSIYAVVADMVWIGSSTQPTHTFTNLPANTTFSVTIGARDAAGNLSPRSAPAYIRTSGPNQGGCTATYRIISTWPGHFAAEVTIRNTGQSVINGWTVGWSYDPAATILQMWNATLLSGPPSVAVRDVGWNRTIVPNQSVTFGFNARQAAAPTVPIILCSSP